MKKTFEHLETQILEKITPTLQEKKKIAENITQLQQQISQHVKKTTIPINLILVGSTAKDTFIRTGVDIDLFLQFPPQTSRDILQEIGLRIGHAVLESSEECFAEHPYVRGYFNGIKTEIVPCYKIESASQKLSAVDRTPLHTAYVKTHLKEQQKPEVRLLKQFLKGIGCYGAEAEIEGFSGYLCELLILKYGTFHQLLNQASAWKRGEVLALTQSEFPSFDTPLIVIDPVDSNRNVASAVSDEKYTLFMTAAKEYLTEPRLTFFFPTPLHPWLLSKITKELTKKEFLGIIIQKPDIIAENLYPQVRKAVRSITELCEAYEFPILTAKFFIDVTTIYIILHPQTTTLSDTKIHNGPPVTLKKNAEEFLQKWIDNPRTIQKPYEKNGRWYTEIKRDYITIKDLLTEQLPQLSLGKHIDQVIKNGFTIGEKEALLIESLRIFWTQYLDLHNPWER